jgi:hypothetical protein
MADGQVFLRRASGYVSKKNPRVYRDELCINLPGVQKVSIAAIGLIYLYKRIIPEDYRVLFKDGDRQNTALYNLDAVSSTEEILLDRRNPFTERDVIYPVTARLSEQDKINRWLDTQKIVLKDDEERYPGEDSGLLFRVMPRREKLRRISPKMQNGIPWCTPLNVPYALVSLVYHGHYPLDAYAQIKHINGNIYDFDQYNLEIID